MRSPSSVGGYFDPLKLLGFPFLFRKSLVDRLKFDEGCFPLLRAPEVSGARLHRNPDEVRREKAVLSPWLPHGQVPPVCCARIHIEKRLAGAWCISHLPGFADGPQLGGNGSSSLSLSGIAGLLPAQWLDTVDVLRFLLICFCLHVFFFFLGAK